MVYCRVGNFGLLSILDDLLRVKHVLSEEERDSRRHIDSVLAKICPLDAKDVTASACQTFVLVLGLRLVAASRHEVYLKEKSQCRSQGGCELQKRSEPLIQGLPKAWIPNLKR